MRARWRREVEWAEAERIVNNVASGKVHRGIAGDVYPKGATLSCTCGHTEHATTEQVADYLRYGWPKHCDKTMSCAVVV